MLKIKVASYPKPYPKSQETLFHPSKTLKRIATEKINTVGASRRCTQDSGRVAFSDRNYHQLRLLCTRHQNGGAHTKTGEWSADTLSQRCSNLSISGNHRLPCSQGSSSSSCIGATKQCRKPPDLENNNACNRPFSKLPKHQGECASAVTRAARAGVCSGSRP